MLSPSLSAGQAASDAAWTGSGGHLCQVLAQEQARTHRYCGGGRAEAVAGEPPWLSRSPCRRGNEREGEHRPTPAPGDVGEQQREDDRPVAMSRTERHGQKAVPSRAATSGRRTAAAACGQQILRLHR
jgi:hypothetical protein